MSDNVCFKLAVGALIPPEIRTAAATAAAAETRSLVGALARMLERKRDVSFLPSKEKKGFIPVRFAVERLSGGTFSTQGRMGRSGRVGFIILVGRSVGLWQRIDRVRGAESISGFFVRAVRCGAVRSPGLGSLRGPAAGGAPGEGRSGQARMRHQRVSRAVAF